MIGKKIVMKKKKQKKMPTIDQIVKNIPFNPSKEDEVNNKIKFEDLIITVKDASGNTEIGILTTLDIYDD